MKFWSTVLLSTHTQSLKLAVDSSHGASIDSVEPKQLMCMTFKAHYSNILPENLMLPFICSNLDRYKQISTTSRSLSWSTTETYFIGNRLFVPPYGKSFSLELKDDHSVYMSLKLTCLGYSFYFKWDSIHFIWIGSPSFFLYSYRARLHIYSLLTSFLTMSTCFHWGISASLKILEFLWLDTQLYCMEIGHWTLDTHSNSFNYFFIIHYYLAIQCILVGIVNTAH